MITAKNYAAQAEKCLNTDFEKSSFKKDFLRVQKIFVDEIKNSVHFALPDGGTIFDDAKKGIRNEKVRLPFTKISIEYYCPEINEYEEGLVWASKRLILAEEMTTQQLLDSSKGYTNVMVENVQNCEDDEIWIVIYAASFYPHVNLWTPEVIGWALPSAWDQPFRDKIEPITDRESDHNGNGTEMYGFPIALCPEMIAYGQKIDGKASVSNFIKDIASEVSALLELCEALSCSNVHHQVMEHFNPAINQRRVRDGKVPMYETRTLWIDVPGGSKDSGDWQGGKHRSPRQHLRRGHIRNLQTGKKVWVNAAVVGAKESGIIKKDYAIKELA